MVAFERDSALDILSGMSSPIAHKLLAAVLCASLFAPPIAFAWGSKGHKIVNRVAWQHLPQGMPAFLRAPGIGREIEFLGPEPDRWRSAKEPELSSAQAPEHYIDLELADLLGPLPRQRWQYVHELYAYGSKHPERAATMVPEKVGLQPWEATEIEERLQAAFHTWREEQAAHHDTQPAERAIVFYMGWLGHYVADGSQPLHTTVQFNGWTGANPHGYTTEHQIHALFETDFVNDAVGADEVSALVQKPRMLKDVFTDYVAYLRESSTEVERTYQLEKAGGFVGKGTPESLQFTEQRLAAAVRMLDSMWLAAWLNSAGPPSQ
jgi:hypothetical protein